MTSASAVLPVARAAAPDSTSATVGKRKPKPVSKWVRWPLGLLIIPGTLAVSADSGALSFGGVSHYLGGWYWPASIDGAIVVMTLLRMFALCFGWRLPGAALFIWAGLGVTIAMNVESVAPHDPTAMRYAHGFEPLVYLVFVESLAWLLKMKLELRHQAESRFTALGWLVSPIVNTRAWLLMQRSGDEEMTPESARKLIQGSIRARSQLLIICPSHWWNPLDAASRARGAALQTIRDGLLTAAEVVELLPEGATRIKPVALLMAVNRAALRISDPAAGSVEASAADHVEVDEVGVLGEVPPAAPPALPVPAPRSEYVPVPAPVSYAAPGEPADGYGQAALVELPARPAAKAPETAVERTGEGLPRVGTTKHSYYVAAEKAVEVDPASDLLSLVSERRIAAASELLAEIGESVTVATVRKYSREFAEWKLGRKLTD